MKFPVDEVTRSCLSTLLDHASTARYMLSEPTYISNYKCRPSYNKKTWTASKCFSLILCKYFMHKGLLN